MANRTFAVGDIHGDLAQLEALLSILPALDAEDTIVFLGDYLDRGPDSAKVVELLRNELPRRCAARVITLRGSHEDAWLKVRREGWPEFILPASNGCLATVRSFRGEPAPRPGELPTAADFDAMVSGNFFPPEVAAWLEALPLYYEDAHAIYVHAGLPREGERWLHPSQLIDPHPLLWQRAREFFLSYRGKLVVFGHTVASALPQEASRYTPEEKEDLFVGECLLGIDTRCGHGGFLTAIELPGRVVYESHHAGQRS